MFAFYIAALTIVSLPSANAQNLKGIWTGNFVSDTTGVPIINTEYVLNVKSQTNNIISGLAYVIEHRFRIEGILEFIGFIDKNKVKISEIRILSSKIPIEDRFLCIKLLDLNLRLTDSIDYLQGHWTGNGESGDRCIPGMAYLKRYKTGGLTKVSSKVLSMIAANTFSGGFMNTKLAEPAILTVRNHVLSVEVSDYLKEDMDTVSIFLNRKSFIRKLKIERKPYLKTLRIDRNAALNEIIMYAENLGRIPPNTSVLTINDGFTKQRVIIQSTKQTSAVIYLRYQPPPK